MGLYGTRRALLGGGRPSSGLLAWGADDLLGDTDDGGLNSEALTFTPTMVKRAVTVPAGGSLVAPLVQGKLDSTAGDVISYGRGTQVVGNWYDTMDPYQFTISFWYRPEFAGNDGKSHRLWRSDTGLFLNKTTDDTIVFGYNGTNYTSAAVSWAAGSWVHIAVALSTQGKIDGTNYVRFSIGGAHSYYAAVRPTADVPNTVLSVGSPDGLYTPDGLISDFHMFRRLLTDGDNVIPAPEGANADEIAALYAAGAGAPASTVIVDYGESCVFGFPTNGTAEALTTGNTDALMAPLRTGNKLTDWHCQTTYASSAWATVGDPATGPADSAACLYGSNCYTWDPDAVGEGVSQQYVCTAGADFSADITLKDDGAYALNILFHDDDNAADILTLATDASGTWVNRNACFKAPAGCTHITVSVLSTNASQGACLVQQCVVQANLWDDPGMEAGTAWTTVGVPITNEQSNTRSHSGTYSWHVAVDATTKGIKRSLTLTNGVWYHIRAWIYITTGLVKVDGDAGLPGILRIISTTGSWVYYSRVIRATASSALYFLSTSGAADWNVDDVSVMPLSPVTLTCTPSNEAASRETMTTTKWGDVATFRVDGRDTLTIPTAGNIDGSEGSIGMWVKFRHAMTWATEYLLYAGGSSPNSFALARIATTNVLYIAYGEKNDLSTATIADTGWHFVATTWRKVSPTTADVALYIDGVAAAGFGIASAAIPTLGATLAVGEAGGGSQFDAAILGVIIGNRAISGGEVLRLYNITRTWVLGDI